MSADTHPDEALVERFNQAEAAKPLYYAKGGYVWQDSIETKNADGSSSFTLGFRICKMMPEVGEGAAETVAALMNSGRTSTGGQP